ncbi:PQQ-binding-like beta-propeller repeat protein [Stieleria mannarensis]|uniref:PQQ-binding-like beta-propeller repeat protein n=1 Tax=Stieleria mannarensis TaxID=2755585 RepID=UPI0016022BC1|nr:PQQ-binding-like beta-propeller repeat protein [Rhodopirellula sp. JC639]
MNVRSFFLPCLLCCCLAQLNSSALGDWSQWRGDNRDGQLVSTSLPPSLKGNVTLAWEKPHAPSYSGPVIFDGMLYTTETVAKKDEKVTAYDLSDGTVAWTAQWEGSMAVPFFAASNGDWIRATPACNKDGLVVVGMRDVIVCLDPKTGTEKWRVDFPKTLGSPLPMFGANCSPLIDRGAVYMQTGGATVKLSMADGSLIWQTLENATSSSPGAFSSPVIATIAGKRQLLVQTRLELCGVDLETGQPLWKQPIQAFRGMNILTPLPIGDRVFTSAHSGTAQLLEISRSGDQWSANEVWNRKQQAYMSSPVLVDGRIYMHLKNERMTALDATTGEATFTTRPIGKYASLISDGTRILALTEQGKLMLLDGTTPQYRLIDEMVVAEDSWAHVAVTDDYLVVRDLGKIKVFRISR